jgi:hypothetical protein
MVQIRHGVPLFLILASASCNVPGDTDALEAIEGDVTSGTSYYLKLPKMIGDTGNCVAIAGSSLSDKAFAVEYDCNGSKSEQFVAEASGLGDGYYRLKNVNSGKCLQVYLGVLDTAHTKTGNVDGTFVQQYTCGTGDNNYWKFASYNGFSKLTSKLHSGDGKYRCMDIRGGDSATANGTNVELWTCGSSTSTKGNQTFNPVAVSSGGTTNPCAASNLVWKTANKTWYTSYPDPGSDECITYSGCLYEGQFQACSGTKSESWVSAHNLAAMFPLSQGGVNMSKHNICIRSGTKTMVVAVVDTCGDSDCAGCCTENRGSADALIDLESYTNDRFGVADGRISWADIGYNANACN